MDANGVVKPVKLVKESSLVADHLLTTKSELARTLSKLMTSEEKLASEQDISAVFYNTNKKPVEPEWKSK